MPKARIIRGNALALPLADGSVDLVVTSPPYFGLRSYQDGGEHYDGQIGSEATPAEFVDALLAATAEMVRVLKPTGSLWVNLGDKYAGQGRSAVGTPGSSADHNPAASSRSAQSPQYPSQPSPYSENSSPHSRQRAMPSSVGPAAGMQQGARNGNRRSRPAPISGVPGKSLIGIPWRYAIRCIDELGLILRAEVIWSKPNGLPESVTDRVRRSHEQWFHFTLQPRYFAAVDEIREQYDAKTAARYAAGYGTTRKLSAAQLSKNTDYYVDDLTPNPLGKLPGSVWTIATEPLKVPDHLGVDHFAAFPTEWPRRIIQGWSPTGICVECGEGRRPVAVRDPIDPRHLASNSRQDSHDRLAIRGVSASSILRAGLQSGQSPATRVTGYACACPEPTAPTTPAIVLDPFGGTGTTALVARALGRHGISVDMSADYCRLAEWRVNDPDQIAKAMRVDKPVKQVDGQVSIFDLDLEGGAA